MTLTLRPLTSGIFQNILKPSGIFQKILEGQCSKTPLGPYDSIAVFPPPHTGTLDTPPQPPPPLYPQDPKTLTLVPCDQPWQRHTGPSSPWYPWYHTGKPLKYTGPLSQDPITLTLGPYDHP